MPSKSRLQREKERARYENRKNARKNGTNQNNSESSDNESESIIAQNLRSPSMIIDSVQIGDNCQNSRSSTPFSETSSIGSNSSGRGRPKKRKGRGGGRPKKMPHIQTNQPVLNINQNDLFYQQSTSNQILENVQQEQNNLSFPDRNFNAQIWQVTRIVDDFITQCWGSNDFLDEGSIYAFLSYVATLAPRRAVIISPIYSSRYHLFQVAPDIHDLCYNYAHNWEVAIFPINHPGHFTLVIHERNGLTLFFDSKPNPARGGHDDPYIQNVIRGIVELTPGINADMINVQRADVTRYNLQPDGWSCGYYICLYGESYLLNDKNTFIHLLEINKEKKRILWHVSQLFGSDNVPYFDRVAFAIQQRPQAQNRQQTFEQLLDSIIVQGPDIIVEPEPMDIETEDIQFAIPRLRRSQRIQTRNNQQTQSQTPPIDPNISDPALETHPTLKFFGFPVLSNDDNCSSMHKDIYCGFWNSGRSPDYYDSGNIGDVICKFCRNKLLPGDDCWSCLNGRVELPPLKEYPKEYMELITGQKPESREFITNMSKYNSLFAFASLSAGRKTTHAGGPMPVILNGEFQRKIGSILPGDNQTPSFDQLYIMDSQQALDHRLNNQSFGDWPRRNPVLFYDLDKLIRENHPMSLILKNTYEFYLQLKQNDPDQLNKFNLILLSEKDAPQNIVDPRLHRRQVNLPTQNESTVFAIWASSNDQPPPIKGIWVTEKGGLTELWSNHPQTDSLLYPLFFINGDEGYHKGIPYKKPPTKRNRAVTPQFDNDSVISIDDQSDTASIAETELTNISTIGNMQSTKRKNLSLRDFYLFLFGIRSPENDLYHHIWSAGGGLSQKFVLDIAARVDEETFNYLRRPDMDLRSDLPQNILDYLAKKGGLASGNEIGKVILFRSYMPGFRAYFKEKFGDGCTIMNRFRKRECAVFMLTFTSNPRWPELKKHLFKNGQQLVDRPDILVHYYAHKTKKLHHDLNFKNILGRQLAYAESMEFQKKGGPHLHRVFATDILANPANINQCVWAFYPPLPPSHDKTQRANIIRRVRQLAIELQTHDCREDLCGPRTASGKCQKHFPYDFSNETILYDDRPATYYRPSPADGGEEVEIKKNGVTKIFNNSHVIPYNPYLLLKYETHMNLTFCYGDKTNLKYTIGYPLKSGSELYVRLEPGGVNIDEPAQYARMYYRSACEGMCRALSMPYVRLSHTVYKLPIHLPGEQPVYFRGNQPDDVFDQVEAGDLPKTMLTQYWEQWRSGLSYQKINKEWVWADDPEIKTTLYEKMPELYSYDKKEKIWKKRVQQRIANPVIGRIYRPPIKNQELFALYVLQRHFPGDPEELKMFDDEQYETFVDVARLRGLLSDDSVWDRTLLEASQQGVPAAGMRNLFVQLLVFGNPSNALELWEKYLEHMFDQTGIQGVAPTHPVRLQRIDRALASIEFQLSDYGLTMKNYGLPEPQNSISQDVDQALDRFFFGVDDDDDNDGGPMVRLNPNMQLNADQHMVAQAVQRAINVPPTINTIPRTYFLVGDGGTGKTALYNWLIHALRGVQKRVIACAYTGAAATLLIGGATVHSVFRFGIDFEPNDTPSITVESFHGRRIKDADLIFIDEVSMLPAYMLEAIDRLCKQLAPTHLKNFNFGGKIVIISGDFKQSLPVVPGGLRAAVAASIQSSQLWVLFVQNLLRLTINMRQGPGEREFTEWLRKFGSDPYAQTIEIPKNNVVNSRADLIDFITDNGAALNDPKKLINRLILAPHNATVYGINDDILNMLNTPERTYLSADESLEDRPLDYDEPTQENFNACNPAALPPHELKLKEGAIIILLKNIGVSRGLVNGTRMIVRRLLNDIIQAEVICGNGSGTGTQVCLNRCWCDYNDKRPDGLKFRRLQFPVRLAFAMTIMKAQGQSVTHLGLDYTLEVFNHGNQYTALSRVTNEAGYRVYAPNSPDNLQNGNRIVKNVVADGLTFF